MARGVRGALTAAALLYGVTWLVNRSLLEVRGRSMEPTLWPGDRLLTVPAPRRWVRAGRVVVVADPAERTHLVVKRVAQVLDGPTGARVDVRGDAPDASTDSRQWGPLPAAAVRRLVVARWPDVRTRLHR